jgi:SOS-response transcriptional repressor LexA/DNA-binding Xre family transcriptional regulator
MAKPLAGQIIDLIEDAKILRGIKKKDLAKRLNISPTQLSNLLRGRNKWTVDQIDKLCLGLNISVQFVDVRDLRVIDPLPDDRNSMRTEVHRMIDILFEGRRINPVKKTDPFKEDDTDFPRDPVWVNAPIYGEIVMGDPDETSQQPVDHIPIIHTQIKKGEYILQARGDSMHPVFEAGDLLLVSNSVQAKTGDYVAALLNRRTTLKQLIKEKDGRIILRPLNQPKHKDRIIEESDDLSIQGVVLEIVRRKIRR